MPLKNFSINKNMNRLLIFCLLLNGMLWLSCGNGETKTDQVKGEKKQLFRYNQPKPITSLDPAFARSQNNIWAIDHLFNGLVQLDEQLNIKPAIAKSWEISEDGLTYTFKLREDVAFHPHEAFGEKQRLVTAEDVVYSFNRILDKGLNSPGSWVFKNRVASDPFQAIDTHTFVLKLKKPFRPMLGILTMQYCSVVPKEVVEKYGKEFRSNPVGTGPFKFNKWLESQSLLLSKNDQYFEKDGTNQLPYLDGVMVSFIKDRKTAYLELMNGKIDYISGLEASYVNELLTPEGELQSKQKDKLQFLKSPFLNMEYLGINLNFGDNNNPLRDKKIRQALNYGFDRAQMLRSLRNNVGKAAHSGFTPRGLPSFDADKTKGYRYDADKARKLLAEAGFPNGKDLPEIKLMTPKDYLDLCTFIAKQWEELGVKVKTEITESATLRQMMTREQSPFFRASWIADYPDAESFFTVFYSKNPSPPNYTRFSNVEFDKLYEASLNENDDQKRYDLYQSMDKILIEEAPVIFLYYDETAVFAQKGVKGLSKNAINLLSLKKVRR